MAGPDPLVVVYQKKLFDEEVVVSVCSYYWKIEYSWIVYPKYYSNFSEMVGALYKNAHNKLIKDLDLQKIRRTVLDVQSELIDFSLEIKELFELSPFMTPERRHQESRE